MEEFVTIRQSADSWRQAQMITMTQVIPSLASFRLHKFYNKDRSRTGRNYPHSFSSQATLMAP